MVSCGFLKVLGNFLGSTGFFLGISRVGFRKALLASGKPTVRYSFDDCVFDTGRRELWRAGTAVPVEPQVFDLLSYLIAHRERVVSKEDLRVGVWQGRIVSESTLSSSINAARTAIGDTGEEQRLIRTLPRKGFRFVARVEEEGAPEAGVAATASAEPVRAQRDHALAPPGGGSAPAVRRRGLTPVVLTLLLVAAGALVAVAAVLTYQHWGAANPPTAPPSGQRFDAASVPLIDEEMRRSLASYPNRPDAKAIAITGMGMGVADGQPDAEAARQDALRRCNARTNRQCRLYAVGMDVVWSKDAIPMPAPEDLRFEPLDAPLVTDEIPLVSRDRQDAIARTHMKAANHRALAVTKGVAWTQAARETRAEASRLALELCAEFAQRPCVLLSVDGMLTIRIPKSRPILRIFLPSVEAEMPVDDRQRIGRVYQGPEWRALAKGNGSWHAVAAAPSEAAAIDTALNSCSQTDSDCRLYAIGNFRVAER
jgi:DNA-binding winged helix-turn-helix (wHTH) protein